MTTMSLINSSHPTPGWHATYDLDIRLLNGRPPLNANDRRTYYDKARRTSMVRNGIAAQARDLQLPVAGYAIARLHFIPPTNANRDPANLTATSKPAVDGLTQAGVIPDDGPAHFREIMPVIHRKEEGEPRLWLRVWLYPTRPAEEDLLRTLADPAEDSDSITVHIPRAHRAALLDILTVHHDSCREALASAFVQDTPPDHQLHTMLTRTIQVTEALRLQLTAPHPHSGPIPGSLEDITSCETPDFHHDQGLTSVEYGRICRTCRVREPHHS